MKEKTRREIVKWAVVLIALAIGYYVINGMQGTSSATHVVLPTILATQDGTQLSQVETATPTATTAPVVSDTSGEWTRQDTTPNYDPGDPYGVKFGMKGMGILLILILLNWLFGAAGSAIGSRRKS
ncbi:hypothetical protein KBC80_02130 [Candidatus Woesebacteria bacterium]|jgi:hypothetical protein|nr:hypothetical protein [Candidatus Woesebacteria bacterium]